MDPKVNGQDVKWAVTEGVSLVHSDASEGQDHTKIWTMPFFYLCMINFSVLCSLQMTMTALPIYIAELGAGPTIAGIVTSIFILSSVMIRFWAGNWMDRKGRRMLLIAGIVIYGISTLFFVWAAVVPGLILLRFITGVGYGISSTAAGTMISDIVPASRRGEGMGYNGLFANVSLGAGPFIGFALIANYDFQTMFLVAGGLASLALLFALGVRYDERRYAVLANTGGRAFFYWPRSAAGPAWILFFTTFILGVNLTYVPLFAYSLGIAEVGFYYLTYAVVMIVTRPLGGRLFDKFGHFLIVPLSLISIIVSLILLTFSVSLPLLLLASACFGFGFGAILPTLQAWMINRIAPEEKGSANALYFNSFDLGVGAGALLMGFVASFFSYPMMFSLSALAIVCALVIYLRLIIKEKRPVIPMNSKGL